MYALGGEKEITTHERRRSGFLETSCPRRVCRDTLFLCFLQGVAYHARTDTSRPLHTRISDTLW